MSEQYSESDTSTEDEEESNTTETLQAHHCMNETAHDEENSPEAEDDTSEENSVFEIESHLVNGEHNVQENKLLSTNFEVKETEQLKGSLPIQWINKYSN